MNRASKMSLNAYSFDYYNYNSCYNSQQLCMWLINYYSFYLAIMHRILQLRRWQHCDVSCSVVLNPDSPHVMVATVRVIQPIHYQDMVALAFIIAFFNFEGILSVIIFVFMRDLEVSWWGTCFLSCHLTISPIYCVAEIRVNKTTNWQLLSTTRKLL